MQRLGKTTRVVLHIVSRLLALVFFVLALGGLLVVVGVATPVGTQTVLQTGARIAGAQIQGVQGTLWRGLSVASVHYGSPTLVVDLTGVHVDPDWQALRHGDVHLRALTLDTLSVQTHAETTSQASATSASGPVNIPTWLSARVDRLAIGQADVRLDDQALPVTAQRLDATVAADAQGAQLSVQALRVDDAVDHRYWAQIQAQAQLQAWSRPWPMAVSWTLALDARADAAQWCVRARTLDGRARTGAAASADAMSSCIVQAEGRVEGNLDQLAVTAQAQGAGLALQARAQLQPTAVMPLTTAHLQLTLPDGASVLADVKPKMASGEGAARADRGSRVTDTPVAGAAAVAAAPDTGIAGLIATVSTRNVDPRGLGLPLATTRLTTQADIDVDWQASGVQRIDASVQIDPDSRWNGAPVSGRIQATVMQAEPFWRIENLATDLRLGAGQLAIKGTFGGTQTGNVSVQAQLPVLSVLWPDLPGGLQIQGNLKGTVAQHDVNVDLRYQPQATGPTHDIDAALAWQGSWQQAAHQMQARIARLHLAASGVSLDSASGLSVGLRMPEDGPIQWQVGQGSLALHLPDGVQGTLQLGAASGHGAQWQSAGQLHGLSLTATQLIALREAFAGEGGEAAASTSATRARPSRTSSRSGAARPTSTKKIVKTGADTRVNTNPQLGKPARDATVEKTADKSPETRRAAATVSPGAAPLVLDLTWNLRANGALAGSVTLTRRSGDLQLPVDGTPLALGLQRLSLGVQARAVSTTVSQLSASLEVQSTLMGHISGSASMGLRQDAQGWQWGTPQALSANVQADIGKLDAFNALLGDTMQLGGALQADVHAAASPGKPWALTGQASGHALHFALPDEGVDLSDGTLALHFTGTQAVLDSLRFPAVIRQLPPDSSQIRGWLQDSSHTADGYAQASGHWDMATDTGSIQAELKRYPVVQRTDRFIMLSGTVTVDGNLPDVNVSGKLRADAGWFSLDVLQSVPDLDSDVVVLRAGQAPVKASSTPLGLNLSIDMGSRFMVTGMGLNTGITGTLQVRNINGVMTGEGVLTTKGGRVDAYGQQLQLTRGNLTFQGNIDNPLLDIEALRTDTQVQAGVRISGTAQHPRIDLVSYPAVSDVETLSWLLFGHPPDDSGSDTTLLLSVGSALLGGGEPFYRRLGLDELSVRNGTVGSPGSILPQYSVVADVNQTTTSTLSTQFAVAAKRLSRRVTVSVEESLSGVQTVARLIYALSRQWSAELLGGSVNGVAVVYRKTFTK